jgi:hypothetical protein
MPESILINKAPILLVDDYSLLVDGESVSAFLATSNHHLTADSPRLPNKSPFLPVLASRYKSINPANADAVAAEPST